MIRSFYNLKTLPFQKNININDLYESQTFKEASSRMEYIKENKGFMLLTGDPGAGKSTLLRNLSSSLNKNSYECFYIPLSTVSILDFYRQLCFYLTGEKLSKKAQLFSSIQNGIKNRVRNNKKVPVIIFDEVHLLKNENFNELQIIFNFDFDSVNPAVVILSGQSHLRDRISRDILTSFRQRISMRHHMLALNKEELTSFINHSMENVGSINSIFSHSAIEAIFNHTRGNLRETCNLSLKALYVGAKKQNPQITEEEIFQASKEI
jgi:type II secretory pathway predicted ATPase ExeA